MMLTLKDLKKRKAKPAKVTTPKTTPARRIVERMISAYMSYIKDNPGGTP
jgi:hypothetical protein